MIKLLFKLFILLIITPSAISQNQKVWIDADSGNEVDVRLCLNHFDKSTSGEQTPQNSSTFKSTLNLSSLFCNLS